MLVKEKPDRKNVRNILHFYLYVPGYKNGYNLRQGKLGQVSRENVNMQEWTMQK